MTSGGRLVSSNWCFPAVSRLAGIGGKAELFVPFSRIVSMDDLDRKIRFVLVQEGYLFPITDAEIEWALKEVEMEESIKALRNAMTERAMDLLRIEQETENDKGKLRAYWRALCHILDLAPDDSTYRWGFGFINMLPDNDK